MPSYDHCTECFDSVQFLDEMPAVFKTQIITQYNPMSNISISGVKKMEIIRCFLSHCMTTALCLNGHLTKFMIIWQLNEHHIYAPMSLIRVINLQQVNINVTMNHQHKYRIYENIATQKWFVITLMWAMIHLCVRDHSRYGLSQWEEALLCNASSQLAKPIPRMIPVFANQIYQTL